MDERRYTIYVCGVCGSDEIDMANDSDAHCAACGNWMNSEPLEVVAVDSSLVPELSALEGGGRG